MNKKRKTPPDSTEIIIPQDQVEVIEVASEDIHIDPPPSSSNPASEFRSKSFSFKMGTSSGPHKINLAKPLLGCLFFLFLLFGCFAAFLFGIAKIIQKLFSLLTS